MKITEMVTHKKSLRSETLEITEMVRHEKLLKWSDIENHEDDET